MDVMTWNACYGDLEQQIHARVHSAWGRKLLQRLRIPTETLPR